MLMKIVTGDPSRPKELQKRVNDTIAEAEKLGYCLEAPNRPSVVEGQLYYSLYFKLTKPKGRRASTAESMQGFVSDPNAIERELMTCRGTKRLTYRQRYRIAKSKITLESAKAIAAYYARFKKESIDIQNSRGLKRQFSTLVNQLPSQEEIALDWYQREFSRQSRAARADTPPDWDWQPVAQELQRRGEIREDQKSWTELSDKQRARIISLKGYVPDE